MPLPGSVVTIADAAPPVSPLTDTGTAFVVGLADRGAIADLLSESDAIHSLGEFIAKHGARQTYNGPEYDSVEAFFAEGGSRLFFSRYAGPAAAKATITVPSAGPQGSWTAKSEGAWANGFTVTIASGVVTVAGTVDGVSVSEVSPTLTTVGDAQDWATNSSDYVDFVPSVATTTALSASAARTLAGGADDRTNATDTQRTTALARFGRDLGPGQVLLPGDTRSAAHTLLATHARDYNRFALGDAPDSSSAATVAAAGTAVRALGTELARHIQLFGPWLYGPALTAGGALRTIPASGVHAGLAARIDSGGNPNKAVAGDDARSRFAVGVKYNRTDTERTTLADAGVTVYRQRGGFVEPYDDVVPVNPTTEPEWLGAAGNRLVMRIVADAYGIADAHMFGGVSGPVDLAAFGGDLKGMLAEWFSLGALYSEDGTPAGAFRVETGSQINTPETLAARQLRASLSLKISPNARQVVITITNSPLTATV